MKQIIFTVMAVLGMTTAASAQVPSVQFRLTCDSQSAYKPYVQVRGSIFAIDDGSRDNARGTLRVALAPISSENVSVQGEYVNTGEGRISFLDLEANGYGSIESMYIDLNAGPFSDTSYVITASGEMRRMACQIN